MCALPCPACIWLQDLDLISVNFHLIGVDGVVLAFEMCLDLLPIQHIGSPSELHVISRFNQYTATPSFKWWIMMLSQKEDATLCGQPSVLTLQTLQNRSATLGPLCCLVLPQVQHGAESH